MQASIKDVDEKIFREFKAEAVREGLKIGQALNFAMLAWLAEGKKKPKLRFMNLKPMSWGPDSETASRDMDKILYGD
jgi:hypothetical protein